MANILALANQKGGVGKTTTAVNLAASLGAINRRVLIIDLDPQGNATMGCGVDKHALDFTSGDVLLRKAKITDAIVQVEGAAYAVLPTNSDQTVAEIELITATEREFRLKQALESVTNKFDYVFIDCPPALNTLTVNALVAADGVIIPMQCEYYALEGLSALVSTIERIKQTANPDLQITGLLRTMFDPRNNLANDVSNQLISHFGERVFETVIPRNVRLAEAPSHGLPVLLYDKSSRGALAYLSLAGELLRRDRRVAAARSSGNSERTRAV
ncbi:MAG: ParA family protein [Gammaproteobacteria bacterium]|nr:ParA family protein [Gammaproteobacteria bacterium]